MITRLTEDNVKEIAKLFRDGQSMTEIATKLNVSEGQVKGAIRRLRKLGVKLPHDRNFYERVAMELDDNNQENVEE